MKWTGSLQTLPDSEAVLIVSLLSGKSTFGNIWCCDHRASFRQGNFSIWFRFSESFCNAVQLDLAYHVLVFSERVTDLRKLLSHFSQLLLVNCGNWNLTFGIVDAIYEDLQAFHCVIEANGMHWILHVNTKVESFTLPALDNLVALLQQLLALNSCFWRVGVYTTVSRELRPSVVTCCKTCSNQLANVVTLGMVPRGE